MSDMNITQPSFSSGIISTEMFSRIDFDKILSGLKQCENFVIRPAGGAIFRAGTRYIAEAKYPNKRISLISFIYNKSDGLCLEFGDKYIRFFKNGAPILSNGNVYEITTPYTEAELSQIKYAQDKNNMYLVHPNHKPAVLTRQSDNLWELRDLNFNPSVVKVSTVTIAKDTAKDTDTVVNFDGWQYAVSVVTKDDEESLATYSNVITSDIDLSNQPINISFPNPNAGSTNIKEFRIYRIKGGEFYLVYVKDWSSSPTFNIKDVSFSANEAISPKEKFDAFDNNNYPSAVGIWNQRLILGGTPKDPNTFWMSRIKQFEDFTETPVMRADDGIELTFNSGTLDAITDFIPMDDLISFTEGKIWRVSGTSADTMSARIESYTGASGIRPFAAKKSILFVDNSMNTISNFVYSYELNGYSGEELNTLSRQLFDGYIINDVSYKDTPYGIMYCIRNDGVLLALTYMREQNIYAWHKHTTNGKFKNVCCVDAAQEDMVYVAVERFGKTYIEVFGSYINEQQDINDAIHLDCCSSFKSNVWDYKRTYTVKEEEYTVEVFNSGSPQTRNINISNDGLHEITLIGAGGNGADAGLAGGAGGGVILVANLIKGNYTITVGEGANETGYPRNFKGIKGGDTIFSGEGITITAGGGQGRAGHRKGSGGGARGYVSISSTRPYNITRISKNGEISALSFADGTANGYGAGGPRADNPEDTSGRTKGFNGYCLIKYLGKNSYVQTDTLYTDGKPEVGGRAYYDVSLTRFAIIDEVSQNSITVDGKIYNFNSSSAPVTEIISGLDRFNDMEVTAVIDTNVYDNLFVHNGVVTLPYESSNVLIGLRYNGILETIPNEYKGDSGSSTVGNNRKVNNGTLSYYRSRGLWYGKDINHMYEIKPYTQNSYGDNIPLESGTINLKVSDGYSLENTFVVMQKSPMPALIQSITLGSSFNGKS